MCYFALTHSTSASCTRRIGCGGVALRPNDPTEPDALLAVHRYVFLLFDIGVSVRWANSSYAVWRIANPAAPCAGLSCRFARFLHLFNVLLVMPFTRIVFPISHCKRWDSNPRHTALGRSLCHLKLRLHGKPVSPGCHAQFLRLSKFRWPARSAAALLIGLPLCLQRSGWSIAFCLRPTFTDGTSAGMQPSFEI